jgi:mycothiol synthase
MELLHDNDILTRTCWLAEAADQCVGYSYFEQVKTAEAVNFWLHGVVHPLWRGRGIGLALLQRSWDDIQQSPPMQAGFGNKPIWVHGWSEADDIPHQRLLTHFGLQPYHIYHELSLPTTAISAPPPLPTDMTIRAWSETAYAAAVTLRNQAFAESWGYQPTTAEALRRRFQSGRYQAAYSFTAWHSAEMVGLIHGHWQPKAAIGEVVWVAVAPTHRQHGLGAALMLTLMETFRQAGAQTITLSADNHANQPNINLYLGLGFQIQTAIIDYQYRVGGRQ